MLQSKCFFVLFCLHLWCELITVVFMCCTSQRYPVSQTVQPELLAVTDHANPAVHLSIPNWKHKPDHLFVMLVPDIRCENVHHSYLQKTSKLYSIKSQPQITYHAAAHLSVLSDFHALSVALSSKPSCHI